MSTTPHDAEETLAFARAQHRHLDPPDKYGTTWHNDCQAFCHCAWGLLTGGFATAWLQWLGLHPDDKHITADLSGAPLGALLFSRRPSGGTGHVWLAARPMSDGRPGSWSTDTNPDAFGGVGKVHRTYPRDAWGHVLLGWGTSVNGVQLDLTHH